MSLINGMIVMVLHMYLMSKVLETDLHVLFHFHIEF